MEYEIDAADHPVASRLPRPTAAPAIVGDPDDFYALMRPPGGPTSLADYIDVDRPQLGLHIVSFSDTTLVSLYWPHTLFDAMGKKALLDAWTLMIQGREDEVEAPYGTDFDPLDTLGTDPAQAHRLEGQRMGLLGLLGYALRQIPSFLAKQENRMVCVPASFLKKLRETAIADLAAARKDDQTKEEPFLSEGDVLCAWWTRLAIAHLPPSSTRTVALYNAYDIRKALWPDLLPRNASYVSNAIGFIHVLLPAQDIVSKPLSHVASAIRSAIDELGARQQVEAFFAMQRASRWGLQPFFGDSGMHMVTYSNWTKARLFELDFSAAVVGEKGVAAARDGSVGRPRYIQNSQFGLTLPNGYLISGKDGRGNYWLSGYMNKGHWGQIEELLAREEFGGM